MEAVVRVALPEWFALRPGRSWSETHDVSSVVDEWALAFLEPVEALRRNITPALAQPGWALRAKATVTPSIHRLVRDVADDREVDEQVRAALRHGELGAGFLPLLLGLAVVTAVEANIGRASAVLVAEVKKRREASESAAAQRERKRSAPAAARERAAGRALRPSAPPTELEKDRPTLTTMPVDAWGASAR